MSEHNENYNVVEIFNWYRQFSHQNIDLRFLPDHNAFCKVPEEDFRTFEAQTKLRLPDIYKQFLLEVGEGRLKQDRLDRVIDANLNYFLGPESIAELMSKETEEWKIYPEFTDDDEIPFFDLGSASVFTFCPSIGPETAVWRPNKFKLIANSFVEFLALLREDIEFYNTYGRSLNS